ncbi:TPA: helix-turn-helix transcriptional regulator [Burkholderia vietnamiensis]|nr:helix-turn-helix transcriptional regulator [Burkholderia vietnamiensis]HDR9212317.1 helix-turn-helix transcriptional regulator [Burkholderia vietnamiensis]
MNNVRLLRKILNLSQAELARCIGVTQSALSHYENGACDPLVETARRLIAFAGTCGIKWRLEDVYGSPEVAQPQDGGELPSTDASDDTQPPAGAPDNKESV